MTVQAVQELAQWSSEQLNPQQSALLRDLVQEFLDIFAARDYECTWTGLVQNTINTCTAVPIRLRPYRLPLAKREAAERLIQTMAAAGVIEPSNSPWTFPAILVRKKNGAWRPCVDCVDRIRLGRNRNGGTTSTAGASPSRLERRCGSTTPPERKAFHPS